MSSGTAPQTPLGGTVRDIMQTELTTVPPDITVRELTRTLSDAGISGAPVVDQDERLLGVVSTSDVIRMAAEDPGTKVSSISMARVTLPTAEEGDEPLFDEAPILGDFFLPEEAAIPVWGEEAGTSLFDEVTVEEIMTDTAFTVDPALSVPELAEFLLRGRIHRAVVTDGPTLVGIVTTMDILRAIVESS